MDEDLGDGTEEEEEELGGIGEEELGVEEEDEEFGVVEEEFGDVDGDEEETDSDEEEDMGNSEEEDELADSEDKEEDLDDNIKEDKELGDGYIVQCGGSTVDVNDEDIEPRSCMHSNKMQLKSLHMLHQGRRTQAISRRRRRSWSMVRRRRTQGAARRMSLMATVLYFTSFTGNDEPLTIH